MALFNYTGDLSAFGVTTIPGALTWDSVRFPPENGEDPVSLTAGTDGESGLLYLASSSGSANLVASGTKWLGTAGACVACVTIEPLIYDGLNRLPHLIGTDAVAASPSVRSFGLRYSTRSGQSTTNAHCFQFAGRGESAASAGFFANSAPISTGVRRVLVAGRFDGTNFVTDIWDCETGTKIAGTPVAKPVGWLGIQNLTYNTSIGAVREERYPLSASANTAQTINAFRGEIDFVAMLDTNPTDADFQAVALGADPWQVFGTGNVRMGAKLAADGGATFPVISNRAAFASGATLTKRGTLYPGSSIRRSGTAATAPTAYFTVDRLPDPCLCTMRKSDTTARLDVGFKIGTYTGAIQCRVQDEDGTIHLPDWRPVTTASGSTASGVINLPFNADDKAYRLTFRIPDGADGYAYAYANSDVVVAEGIVHMGQSEMVRALAHLTTVTGATGNTLGLAYDGAGGKHAYRCDWVTDTNGVKRAVITRSRYNYFLAGGGQLALVNRLREHTTRPLAIVNAAISGTSGFAFMNDADTSRRWSDFELALSALGNRNAAGKPIVRAIAMMWEAFLSGTVWAAQFLKPFATGVQSVTQSGSYIAQADIDHYLFDGLSFDADADLVVIPANRAGAAGTATTDVSSMGTKREDMRNNSSAYYAPVLIGKECAVHACETSGTDSSTHPDTTRNTGLLPWCRKIADSIAVGLGLIDEGAPTMTAARTSTTVITVTAAGGTFDTEGNYYAASYGASPVAPIGLTVSGFEVDPDGTGTYSKDGFTAAIATTGTITLTKSSGTWGTGCKVKFNPGGPGGYTNYSGTGNEATENTWVKQSPVIGGHEPAGGNTDLAVTV